MINLAHFESTRTFLLHPSYVQDSPIDVDSYQEDGTWVLEDYAAKTDVTSNGKSTITYAILLTRRTTFYLVNFILPVSHQLTVYSSTSLMSVLEQDMTMYEMSPSWSRSLVPFHSLSFTHSLTQASLPQQTSPDLNARDISHVTTRRHK